MLFNKSLLDSSPYKLVSHKAWDLDNHENVLKLDWNESFISPSPKVKQKLIEFIENRPLNWYPDVANDILLHKLSEYTSLDISQIQYFGSSDSLHEYILRMFFNEKAEITIVSPTYDNFRSTAETFGYKINHFKLDENFDLDHDCLFEYLKKFKQSIVYICSPNNPTGKECPLSTIEYLASNFRDTAFVIDEAYYEFSSATATVLLKNIKNLLITRSFSKAFGLASLRIGYLLSSSTIIEMINKIRNPKNISSLAQIAAIAALNDLDYMRMNVSECNKGKYFFIENAQRFLNKHVDLIYGSGNFILMRLKNQSPYDLILFLENEKIYIRNMSHIEILDGYVRVTCGDIKVMNKLLKKMINYFNEIQK